MNLRAYGMQAGNFGFNTEFGKISINISVLVLLITVYISLLMAPFTGGASAADIGPEVVATRQTISGILSLLATAVGERFGAAALKDLAAAGAKDLATDLATAGAKDLAAGAGKNVAEDVAAAGVKDAAAGAAARVGGQAVARSADSRLSSGVLKVVLQGVVTNVWANIEQLRRDPNASWNWNSTFAAVLAAPLGVGISHGLEAGIAKVATKFVSREAANVADQAATNAADKATTSLPDRALRFTGGTLKVGLVMSVAMPASNALATGDLTHLGDYHTYLGAFVNGAALHGATEAARGLGLAADTTPVTTPDKIRAPTDTPTPETLTEPNPATPDPTDALTTSEPTPTPPPAPAPAPANPPAPPPPPAAAAAAAATNHHPRPHPSHPRHHQHA
jgi:hypothetical protein